MLFSTYAKSSLLSLFDVRGGKPADPAVDFAPPPAVGPGLGVDLDYVSLLQRQLPRVA